MLMVNDHDVRHMERITVKVIDIVGAPINTGAVSIALMRGSPASLAREE